MYSIVFFCSENNLQQYHVPDTCTWPNFGGPLSISVTVQCGWRLNGSTVC